MKKRIIALLLCLSMLLPMVTGSVVANDGDYSANVGRYAKPVDTGYGILVGNFTDITTGNDVFLLYEEFEPDTIFQITDWYLDIETQALWYEVEIYSGGVIPEAQEYWPEMPWILQDYLGEAAEGNSLEFLDTCDTCGKPDCGGHESTGSTDVYLDGVEVSQVTMPQFNKPTLSASTTLEGNISYIWQILADADRQLWVNIYGENSPELTLSYGMVATLLNDSNQAWVRCITIAGSAESVSDALLITVEPYVAPVREDTPLPDLAEPTGPAAEATEPVEEPTESSEESTEPTDEATEPTEEATVPTEPVIEETTAPTVPAEEPSGPAETPSAPAEEPSAPTEPATEPAETASGPAEEPSSSVEEPLTQEAMRLLPLEARIPSNASDAGTGNNTGDPTKIYHVTIHYMFQDGVTPAASASSITVGASGILENPIRYPAVQGYLPYVLNENGQYERQDEFATRTLTADIETTVYYLPALVEYKVEVFLQNAENDNYTKLDTTIIRYAETGSLVPDFTQTQPDDVKLEYPGFYPLLHEMPEVAADGSTRVELYFDRYYYLINFNLNGGYGVEPIYSRYGTTIEVNVPERPGYAFAGWVDANGNAVNIPDTMPINGGKYDATWRNTDTTYKVAYWFINDDGTRSLIGTRIESAISGQTAKGLNDLETSYTCGNETSHTHTADCYSCCQPGNSHTTTCFTNLVRNDPDDNGRAVIRALEKGNDPEPGYIYVIKTAAGTYWPKIYLNGAYYTFDGIGSGTQPATEAQVNSIIEGSLLGTGSYGDLTVTKYKPNIQNTHTDANRTCQEHTHDDTCEEDTTYLEYVDIATVTKADGTTVTYTTDTNVVIQGDGTSVVNVYYRYKQYTLRFYYAATTGGIDTNGDNINDTDFKTIKVVGGTSYYFGSWGPNTANDEDLLENEYWNYSNQWGSISALPTLNATGSARNYTHGAEVFTHNNTAVTYHYISFQARYGDDISGMWPCGVFNSATRTDKNNANGWSGTEAFVSAWNGEHHVKYSQRNENQTIKGVYERLDENLLFDLEKGFTDSSTVSYLCFWENGANISWSVPELYRYNIYLEAYSGQDLTGKTTITRDGKTYYLADSYDTCDNSSPEEQTQVSLKGYTPAVLKTAGNGYTLIKLKQTNPDDPKNPDIYCESRNLTGTTNATLLQQSGYFDSRLYQSGFEINFYYYAQFHTLSFWNHSGYLTNGTGSEVAYNEPLEKYFEGITSADGTVHEGANDLIAKPEYYPATLEPDAYEFEGWYTSALFEPETKVNPATMTMPDENLMVYANWVPKLHHIRIFLTIDLADEGSTHMEDFYIYHGQLVPEEQQPKDPVNGDYQFIGWFYKDADGVERAFDFDNMPVKDGMNLYAKWSSNTLKPYRIRYVTYDKNGNEIAIGAPTTGSALAGSTKTFEAKVGSALYAEYREGYFPLTKSHSITLDIDHEGETVYIFEYEKIASVPYTVHYYKLDLDGNPVYAEDAQGNKVNVSVYSSKTISTKQSEIVENYVRVTGYKPDAIQKRLVLSGESNADNTIIFWYTPNTTHAFLIVNHYLEDVPATGSSQTTWTPHDEYSYVNEVLIVGNETQHFSEAQRTIEGFEYVLRPGETVLEGDLSSVGQELELKLYYKRLKYPYQIQYLEYGTDKELAEPVNHTGNKAAYFDDSITAAATDIKNIDGYAYHSKIGCTIVVEQDPDNPRRNIVKVYYVPVTGLLKITKQINVINDNVPLPSNLEFKFAVTVPNGVYPVTIQENTANITVTDGILTFKLCNGESAIIDGLPQGPSTGKNQYTVTETPVAGFNSSFSPAGPYTVSDGKTTNVTCTNAFPVGTLQIVKTVDEEFDADIWEKGSFSFTITSDALLNGKSYTAAITGADDKTCWVSGNTITLNDIAVTSPNTPVTITIANVPAGSYTVTETKAKTNGASTDDLNTSYTTTANSENGCTATVDVTASDTPAKAEFVNTFNRTTGDLYISKTIEIVPDSGAILDPDAEFTFTVQMPEDMDARHFTTYTVTGHQPANAADTITEVTFGSDGKCSFVLKHGEYLVIEDLPVGSYVITEAPELGYASSFPIPQQDGSVNETVTITTGKQTKLECINTYPVHIGNLEISKSVRNDSKLADMPEDIFTFQVVFPIKNTHRVFPVTRTDKDGKATTMEVTAVESADQTTLTLTVQLKAKEKVLIENLPEGECTVTEVNIPVNFTPEYPEAFNGTISIASGKTQSLAVTNVYNPPSLTIQRTNAEAGQIFVYEVKNTVTNEIITVTVTGNSSTTIHGLVPGKYTVTQKNNTWSWRYEDPVQTVDLPAEGKTVTFSGTIPDSKGSWLDRNSVVMPNTYKQAGG